MKMKFSPFFVVIPIIALLGGVFVLAENSVPGDEFYKIKILVDEPVAGMFALPKKEKAEWEERLVERRLQEVEKLVSADNFSETIRNDVEKNIKNQIDKFTTNISGLALQKNGLIESSDLELRLQAALSIYQNILGKLSEKKDLNADTKKEVTILLSTLKIFEEGAINNLANLESNTATNTENILTSTKLLYQKNKLRLSVNIQNKIDGNLANAEEVFQEGQTFVVSSDYVNAINKFQTAITLANEAKLSIISNLILKDQGDDRNYEESGQDD